MINKTFIKRRYSESRIGAVTINPILAASNFIMLIWITLSTDIIPFWLFVPVFLFFMISLVVIIGYKFRVIQLSTDEDIKYEKQADFNSTLYEMMIAQKDIMEKLGITPSELFMDRVRYVWKITGRTI